jgi:geranylgeranyl diphosphate synthase, type II
MQDLQKFFADTVETVDAELDRLIPSETEEPTTLHQAMRWSVFGGGKRFRPILIFAVGKTFGARDSWLVRTAAAIEMIHTYSLIHDDLPSMDDDDMRRGRATCHKKFGEATAILTGDALQALAFKTIAEDEDLKPEVRVRLLSEIATAAGSPDGMVGGQQMDLEAEGRQVAAGGIDRIHELKTGALIRFAAIAGAIIAGGTEGEIRVISDYGADLGRLFQITDDLLDVTQTSDILGKTAKKDIAARKATYPSIIGISDAVELAEGIHARAISVLSSLDHSHELLTEIAGFILSRKY